MQDPTKLESTEGETAAVERAPKTKEGRPAASPPLKKRLRHARKRLRARRKALRERRMRLRRRSRYLFAAARRRHTYRDTLEHLITREELPILLNRRGLVRDGVEIGVKKGAFSESLLGRWRGDRLISIDPWREADPGEYVDDANVAQRKQDKFFQHTQDRLARFGDRSEIWRLTSLEGAERISPHSLDFVFIDARHDYESVLEDLDAWFDKVRPGGIISGHDYVDGDLENGVFGVKSAVDEFFAARGIPVHDTERPDPLFPSWFAEIPAAEVDGDGTGSQQQD